MGKSRWIMNREKRSLPLQWGMNWNWRSSNNLGGCSVNPNPGGFQRVDTIPDADLLWHQTFPDWPDVRRLPDSTDAWNIPARNSLVNHWSGVTVNSEHSSECFLSRRREGAKMEKKLEIGSEISDWIRREKNEYLFPIELRKADVWIELGVVMVGVLQ